MPNNQNNVNPYCLTATAGTKNLLGFYLKINQFFILIISFTDLPSSPIFFFRDQILIHCLRFQTADLKFKFRVFSILT